MLHVMLYQPVDHLNTLESIPEYSWVKALTRPYRQVSMW